MLQFILILLVVLWFLGYLRIPWLPFKDLVLFSLNGHPISPVNVLIFVLIIWAIDLLPQPFRTVAAVVLIIWVLSIIGIVAIAGLSTILEVAVIVGLIYYLLVERKR